MKCTWTHNGEPRTNAANFWPNEKVESMSIVKTALVTARTLYLLPLQQLITDVLVSMRRRLSEGR